MSELGRLGKYELVTRLGEGPMGVLYLAHDPFLGRTVAIKYISREFSNPIVREAFLHEARAAAAIKHPNIVRVYDLDIEGAQVFIVMEYIDGESLRDLIDRCAPLSLCDRLRMFDQVCAAIAQAHKADWVHRDVRAGNVMLDREDGFVKLLIGSPSFITPEQIRGEAPTKATDVFAAGALLYELLTYQRPFAGDTNEAQRAAILGADPRPPSAFVRVLPGEMDGVVRRAMAKSPSSRYPDIDSFRAAVLALAADVAEREKIPAGETVSLSDVLNRPAADAT